MYIHIINIWCNGKQFFLFVSSRTAYIHIIQYTHLSGYAQPCGESRLLSSMLLTKEKGKKIGEKTTDNTVSTKLLLWFEGNSCVSQLPKLTTAIPPPYTHTHVDHIHLRRCRCRFAGGKVFPHRAPGPNKRFTTPVKFRRPPRRRGHVARKQLTFRPIEQPNYYLRQV